MSKEQIISAVFELPPADQESIGLAIIQRLHVTSTGTVRTLSDADLAEIHRRRDAYLADPATGKSIQEIEAARQEARRSRSAHA